MAAEEAVANRVDVAAAYGGDGTVKTVGPGFAGHPRFPAGQAMHVADALLEVLLLDFKSMANPIARRALLSDAQQDPAIIVPE